MGAPRNLRNLTRAAPTHIKIINKDAPPNITRPHSCKTEYLQRSILPETHAHLAHCSVLRNIRTGLCPGGFYLPKTAPLKSQGPCRCVAFQNRRIWVPPPWLIPLWSLFQAGAFRTPEVIMGALRNRRHLTRATPTHIRLINNGGTPRNILSPQSCKTEYLRGYISPRSMRTWHTTSGPE